MRTVCVHMNKQSCLKYNHILLLEMNSSCVCLFLFVLEQFRNIFQALPINETLASEDGRLRGAPAQRTLRRSGGDGRRRRRHGEIYTRRARLLNSARRRHRWQQLRDIRVVLTTFKSNLASRRRYLAALGIFPILGRTGHEYVIVLWILHAAGFVENFLCRCGGIIRSGEKYTNRHKGKPLNLFLLLFRVVYTSCERTWRDSRSNKKNPTGVTLTRTISQKLCLDLLGYAQRMVLFVPIFVCNKHECVFASLFNISSSMDLIFNPREQFSWKFETHEQLRPFQPSPETFRLGGRRREDCIGQTGTHLLMAGNYDAIHRVVTSLGVPARRALFLITRA